jgi:hypothetical protein
MSYATIHQNANDTAFQSRVTSAVAQEGHSVNPIPTMLSVVWAVASASDVEAAYASALAAGNPSPGGDEAVITDGMILSKVQEALADLPAP